MLQNRNSKVDFLSIKFGIGLTEVNFAASLEASWKQAGSKQASWLYDGQMGWVGQLGGKEEVWEKAALITELYSEGTNSG